MPVKSYKLGPGKLTLGVGTPLEVNAQLTSAKVVPTENVETTDAVPVLSGESIAAEDKVTYSFTLQGTFFQDISATGVVAWSWTNRGTSQAFSFIPNTVEGREVEGFLRPVPLQIGGDEIGGRPTADFTWQIIGTPDFTAID